MPGPFSLSMIDIVHKDQDKDNQQFVQNTEDFPCLFNLRRCKLDICSQNYTGKNVCELNVTPNKWKSLLKALSDDSDVSEGDNEVWKDNLLTYVYAELGEYGEAIQLNKKIRDQHGMYNLVALVNAAFLFFKTGNLKEAYTMLDKVKKLKCQQTFADLKLDAICELGYTFRQLGGANNLQFSISFLEFVLLFRPRDEQIQLMLAIVYRRCTHFHIYSADPENINRHDFALKAATSLFKLGTTSKNTSFKAAALIELANLKNNDDLCDKRNFSDNDRILSREEWCQIVQQRTSKQLCEEALEVCDDGPSEKVLKIAGQLYRYYDDDGCLKKSKQLLKTAITKINSNTAHHQLGLTYMKMAARHEQRNNTKRTYLENIQGANVRYNVKTSWQYKLNRFDNNAVEMKGTNRGNYHQRSEHNARHPISENNTQGAGGYIFKVLPQLNNSQQQLENRLKPIIKVPSQFKSFSKDNPYTDKAIHHLKQAVELSCCQNKKAVYDLACTLVQAEYYEKSKETCKELIKEYASFKTLTTDPICLVNAYNLYGICCAKEAEAEVNQVNKKRLEAESEERLTVAVRLASCLAASVPELEMCATDLWNAFSTLQKKFKFEGQKESREKLFRICEFISDYRCLEAIDDIVSQDSSELQKIEVIEQCLQRYLNMKAYDRALLFRDLVSLQPGIKPKLSNSLVYRQLVLEVAEGKLNETYLGKNTGEYHPDHVWKQLFNDEFCVTENSKKYDIVIVSDFDDDCELKRGMMRDISEYLKLVLLKTFGFNVVRAHEETYAGDEYLEKKLEVISSSHVSIFVLTAPYTGSLSLASEIAGLMISESGHTVPESSAVNNESQDCCTPEGAMADNQNENENLASRMYKRIISASISNVLSKAGATRMMLVVPYSLKFEDLPQAVRGLPTVVLSQGEIETLTATIPDRNVVLSQSEIETLTATVPDRNVLSHSEIETLTATVPDRNVLSQSEIETLTAAVPGRSNEQNVNLMKKIFRAVLGNC